MCVCDREREKERERVGDGVREKDVKLERVIDRMVRERQPDG